MQCDRGKPSPRLSRPSHIAALAVRHDEDFLDRVVEIG
jgi:hypothetical protein